MGWFLEICILVLVFSSVLSLESFQMNDKIAKCLSYMAHTELLAFTTNMRINIKTDSKEIKWKFEETIEQFLVSNNFIVDLDSSENLPYTIHWRLLFVDSLASFRYLVETQRENDPDTAGINQYYIAILPVNMNMDDLKDIMTNITDFCWGNFIININILIEEPDGIVTVYTYNPFKENKCGNTQPTILSRCENGSFDSNRPAYSAKLDNFWQCPMTAILWHDPPFVIMDQEPISGVDGQILSTLAHRMNFSLNLLTSANEMGDIYSNGTATGSFKLLIDGQGDLMIQSAVCTPIRQDRLASVLYYISPKVAYVKRPKPYGSLEILILPFDWYTWLIILILISGKLIFQVIWRKFFKNIVPYAANSSRLCTLSWLFGIFILTSSYEGSIFKFIHNRARNAAPKNIEDAVRDGYKIITNSFLLIDIPELKDHLIILDKSLIDLFTVLDMLENNYAVIADETEFLALRESDSFKHRNYVSLHEPVYQNSFCIYMPKFTFLTDVFDEWIYSLLECGYIQQMYNLFIRSVNYKNEMNDNGAPMKISLQQSMGAFRLLGVLLGISTFVFVLELLSVRYQRLRFLIDSLNG